MNIIRKTFSAAFIAAFSLPLIGDNDPLYSFKCFSTRTFPAPQCAGSVEEYPGVEIKTDRPDDDSFINAGKILVEVKSGGDEQTLETVQVTSQEQLPGGGASSIKKENGTVVLVPAEAPYTGLKQKDSIVIIDADSGVKNVNVDARAGAPGQNGGNVIVVADKLQSVTINTSGYNGKNGLPAVDALALSAVSGDASKVAPGVATSYIQRREADPSLTLSFDSSDINNYKASGLKCRADEVPFGGEGTFAFLNPTQIDRPAEQFMEIVSAATEQSKRAFCRRSPEVSVSQSCAPEDEYSFQAICRVRPESRSLRVFKRDSVRWRRALCAQSVAVLMRRSVVRKARLEISIPFGKSYVGIVEQTIPFVEAYQIVKPNFENGAYIDPTVTGNGTRLAWFSPFYRQDPNIQSGASIEVSDGRTVGNGWNDTLNPPPLTSPQQTVTRNQANGDSFTIKLKTASQLTFIPRGSSSDPTNGTGLAGHKNLFQFDADSTPHTINTGDNNQPAYSSIGCAPVVDRRATRYRNLLDNYDATPPKFSQAMEYFTGFDVSRLGFTQAELVQATNGGLIRVTGCEAYELTEAITGGTVQPGEWVLDSGVPDQDAPNANIGTPLCQVASAHPVQIGVDVYYQYEREDSCYATDPRDPPTWLKLIKARALGGLGIPNVNDDNLVDLSEGGSVDAAVKENDFAASELLSSSWNVNNITSGFKFSTTAYIGEFNFPPSLRPEEVAAIRQQNASDYCINIPDSPDYYNVHSLSLQTLTKSVRRSKMTTYQDHAIATGEVTKVCPSGVRLDRFLTHVQRPTCPVNTSTKLRLSRWSRPYGALNWATMNELDSQGQGLSAEINHTFRSELSESRYDDLPARVFTRRTHEVHPSQTITPVDGITGNIFPPDYGFTKNLDGQTVREFAGWMRDKKLLNKNGAGIAPDSFTPYDGATLFDRGERWCNANAFDVNNGKLVNGFGAKGILRDAPKRLFSFDFDAYDPTTGGYHTAQYVGVEIVNFSSSTGGPLGFYALDDSSASIKRWRAGESVRPVAPETTTAELSPFYVQNFFSSEAFKVANYPNFPNIYSEACQPGEHFNAMFGFCHLPGEPTKPRRRLVEQYLKNDARRQWDIPLNTGTLQNDVEPDLSVPRVDIPFFPLTNGIGLDVVNGQQDVIKINPTESGFKPNDFMRLGFLRPSLAMTNDARGVFKEIGINRPESIGKMMLSPGFAASRESFCNKNFMMLAVPVPPDTSVGPSGQIQSMSIDRDNYLQGSTISGRYYKPIYVIVRVACNSDNTNYTVSASVVGLNGSSPSNFSIDNFNTLTSEGSAFVRHTCQMGSPTCDLSLEISNPSLVTAGVRLRNIRETLVAGLSPTTGNEKLDFLEIATPLKRNRSQEWEASGLTVGGSGWKSLLATEKTPPSIQQDISPKECNAEGLKRGIFHTSGGNQYVNGREGAVSATCRSVGGEGCALSDEELSLFTKAVTNSKQIDVIRAAVSQFTPWSHELVSSAAKNLNYQSTASFGDWSIIGANRPEASVPGCEMYNSPDDATLATTSISNVAIFDGDFIKINRPAAVGGEDLIRVPLDGDKRKSQGCTRWDTLTGDRCDLFGPTIEGPSTQPLVFGGVWSHVFIETKERVAQDCYNFVKNAQVSLAQCASGYLSAAASVGICTPASGGGGTNLLLSTAPLCRACTSVGYPGASSGEMCAPNIVLKGEQRREQCTPSFCPFATNRQTLQVEASRVVSGSAGEDGTNAGSAILFCRDCPDQTFLGQPGLSGIGTSPIASSRSLPLVCMSWNQNRLNPIYSVRELWSQPFISGSSGKNGRPGEQSGTIQVYDLFTEEALFLLNQGEFWIPQK